MRFIALNLSMIVGASTEAKLLGMAGGLTNLSKMPSCNILLLGSQRKDLRGFSSKAAMPHAGFIFSMIVHPFVFLFFSFFFVGVNISLFRICAWKWLVPCRVKWRRPLVWIVSIKVPIERKAKNFFTTSSNERKSYKNLPRWKRSKLCLHRSNRQRRKEDEED